MPHRHTLHTDTFTTDPQAHHTEDTLPFTRTLTQRTEPPHIDPQTITQRSSHHAHMYYKLSLKHTHTQYMPSETLRHLPWMHKHMPHTTQAPHPPGAQACPPTESMGIGRGRQDFPPAHLALVWSPKDTSSVSLGHCPIPRGRSSVAQRGGKGDSKQNRAFETPKPPGFAVAGP